MIHNRRVPQIIMHIIQILPCAQDGLQRLRGRRRSDEWSRSSSWGRGCSWFSGGLG
jgi:hypothetical protein